MRDFITPSYSALKFFYVQIQDREWNICKLPRPKGEQKLPVVLSRSEVHRLFEVTENLKHKALLMTFYSSGLRLSEGCHLQLGDIDSARVQIRVRQGKGKKDRYTLLSQVLLSTLRSYYRSYRPTCWLFYGANRDQPLHPSSFQRAFYRSRDRAGITKPVSVHTLRHSFATHLIEQGVAVLTVQQLLGHRHLKTTTRYIHLCRDRAPQVLSPLDVVEEKP